MVRARRRVPGEHGNRGLRFNSPEARHARPRLAAAAASQLFAAPRFLSVLSASAQPVERPQASSPLRDVLTKATTPENLRSISSPPGSRGSGCGPTRTPDVIKRNSLDRRSNRKTPAKYHIFGGPADGLTMVFTNVEATGFPHRPVSPGFFDLFIASRTSLEDPFANITNLRGINTSSSEESSSLRRRRHALLWCMGAARRLR